MKPSLRHHLKALSPSYWFQCHEADDAWDKKLRLLMSEHRFTVNREDPYFILTGNHPSAMLGGHEIWILNHPYGSFSEVVQGQVTPSKKRPYRSTIAMAHERMIQDLAEAK